jgi:tetratricopeptide (TPR) repeat protein
MTSNEHEPAGDFVEQVAVVVTVAQLAHLLRALRRREARERQGPPLTYQQLAERTGLPVATVGAYLSGVALAPADRFDDLLLALRAKPHERGPFATARDRVGDTRGPQRTVAGVPPASVSAGLAEAVRMLPAAVSDFTGRGAVLARLDGLIEAADARASPVAVVAGMGGVGKTTLAVHWAHSVAHRFPGGQLYINLRGYDPGEPLSTLDALGVLLGGVGLPAAAVPAELDGRVALYRAVLSGRRALVVLDNAGSGTQVASLLPPSPCLTLVTSRDDLPDLPDARRVRLDVFVEDEAVTLLRRLVGARAEREPEAVRALARHSGYLPLALRVIAELAVFRADASLSDLVDELRADYQLDGLDGFPATGDARSDLRAVFSWSMRWLPEAASRAFRLIGTVPGRDVDEFVVAALAGSSSASASRWLETLRRAHLIDAWPPGRYSMHDLVRAHARQAADRDLDAGERQASMTRLLDYYLHATTVAVGAQWPSEKALPGAREPVPAGVEIPELAELETAARWLVAERANIADACVYASGQGWPRHAIDLAKVVWVALDNGVDIDVRTVHLAALAAADHLGDACDPGDRARLVALLALSNYRAGELEDAGRQAEEAVAVGVRVGASSLPLSLTVLGAVRSAQGRFTQALSAFERVVDVVRDKGPAALLTPLANLGQVHLDMERYEASGDYFREAARIASSLELRHEAAEAHRGMAMVLVRLGRCVDALPIAIRATEVVRESGYTLKLTTALDTLAQACRGVGRMGEALEHLQEAVEICREIASTRPTAQLLNTLGETYREAGEHTLAGLSHEEALEFAERASDRREIARALLGRADAYAAQGDRSQAVSAWRQARTHYVQMALPHSTALVQARLRAAGSV